MTAPAAGPAGVTTAGVEPGVTRRFLVHLPVAEARHLAGTGPTWPASPEHRLALALREWLASLPRRRSAVVPARTIVAEVTRILEAVPLPRRPVRGPFGPGRDGLPLAGTVEYVGGGVVRLDDTAITALAGLPGGEDFRVSWTDAGPVLTVGADVFLAREEEPAPDSRPAPAR